MSSIMRRRSGLMAISVIGGSCLEDEVANSSILKTGRRPHHHPFTSRRSSRALPCAQRPPARAGSFCGTLATLGECPHGVGKQPSAAQLSATFAAFDDRPNQLPGCDDGLAGLAFIGIYLVIYSHEVFYGTGCPAQVRTGSTAPLEAW